MNTRTIVRPVLASAIIVLTFFSAAGAQGAASGTTKTLRFVEGQIKTSNGTNHSRVSTDLAGGIVAGISTSFLTAHGSLSASRRFRLRALNPAPPLPNPLPARTL